MKVAVDGMGGDFAPQLVVEGAVQAANSFDDLEIVITGREDAIKRELYRHKVTGGKISIRHASEVVEMSDSPVQAIKKKKDSSLSVCIQLLKQKETDAVVTAGNTGAAVAAATLNLGLLPGIKRPGIAIAVPTLRGITIAVDVGANIDPTPEHLLQYAIMGDTYARYLLRKKKPSIGLLNIGEEESKGTETLQETYKLLRDSGLNFLGNIEGRDFFSGKCDVIVCDGFAGNVVLKMTESILEMMITLITKEIQKDFLARIGAFLCKPAFESIRRETNYEEAGGAPLLGVDGVVIIGHGISSAKAVRNAIRVAREAILEHVNEHIIEGIHSHLNAGLNPPVKSVPIPKVNP
ncbi:MAG: phosphate acyltransferase PlsX [Candidatus Omnitrophica bacterium]|nr:phosphate acyltransferase PlsX [Candidatus Omnitrophota bacterium]